MRDHEIAKFVNELTEQANTYWKHQSMRSVLSRIVHKHVVYPTCLWRYTSTTFVDDHYDTECSNSWVFTEGNLEDNEISYCPYCGKLIKDGS